LRGSGHIIRIISEFIEERAPGQGIDFSGKEKDYSYPTRVVEVSCLKNMSTPSFEVKQRFAGKLFRCMACVHRSALCGNTKNIYCSSDAAEVIPSREFMTTKTSMAETNAFSSLGNALESAAEKFGEGSTVARQSVAQAAKVTRNFLADGVYKSTYWTSYGFVFSAVYLVELFPETNSFRRGLVEASTDARTRVHEGKKRELESSVPSPRSGKNRSVRKRRPAKKADVADSGPSPSAG
jgi:hypothetical protein